MMVSTMSYLDVKQAFERVLEQVLTTAAPIQFEFKGKKLAITLVEPESKLARLEPHPDCLRGDPEAIVHLDWSEEVHVVRGGGYVMATTGDAGAAGALGTTGREISKKL